MKQVVIENPILNSPFEEPERHFKFKVATARDFRAPAVNNHGGFGKWAFLEILDPWNTKNSIREFIHSL